MRPRNLVSLLTLAAISLTVGRADIVDGEVVRKGDPLAKFTVRIFSPDGICTGTLVTRNIVMTAAHCMVDESGRIFPHAEDSTVVFNRFEEEILDLDATTKITASKAILDRGYIGSDSRHTTEDYSSRTTKNHDVGLIRLAKDAPAEFAPIPIALHSEIEAYSDTLLVAGYGKEVDVDDGPSGRLKSAKVTLVENDARYSRIRTKYGNGLSCSGDSGGPLLIKTPEGYKLAGVHNTGQAGCRGTASAARIVDYTDFLDQAMRRLGSSSALLFTTKPPVKQPGSFWSTF